MATSSHSGRAARARSRVRGAVALARVRLRRSGGGRSAVLFAGLIAAGFAASALVVSVTDGGDAAIEGFLASAAQWIVWSSGVSLAFAAARNRRALDRGDGIDVLAASRGIGEGALESARVLAAMVEGAVVIGVPLIGLALLIVAVSGSARLALARLGLVTGAAAYAMIAGGTLGALGALCGKLGRSHGRWLLVAAVAGPWILADLAGHASWSIPGALDAVLDFTLRGGVRA